MNLPICHLENVRHQHVKGAGFPTPFTCSRNNSYFLAAGFLAAGFAVVFAAGFLAAGFATTFGAALTVLAAGFVAFLAGTAVSAVLARRAS